MNYTQRAKRLTEILKTAEDTLTKVRSAFRDMLENGIPGNVESLPELRAKLPELSKKQFDDAILQMAENDEIALHLHDLPAALNKNEREKLVLHPDGTHFIGIAPRRKSNFIPDIKEENDESSINYQKMFISLSYWIEKSFPGAINAWKNGEPAEKFKKRQG